ncbi:MAG TPA: J domain-containing protein [Pyrinomonadaceae bacterium]|nr:J domain-containing protein [Pyrinomonadaceae bacterium]
MRDERSDCYELLGVAPGASAAELKAAHRDLVKVWHPDRFAHDPRLQQKAQEKLKEINDAYDLLTSGKAARRAPPPAASRRETPKPVPSGRWPLIVAAALVFGLVFFVASRALVPEGGAHTQPAAPSGGRTQAATAVGENRPEAEGPAAGRQTRDRKQAERRPAEETASPAEPPRETAAEPVRPLPTVTLLIDPTTGLLATRDCPVRSRMTYASGSEPRRSCDAHVRKKTRAEAAPGRTGDSRPEPAGGLRR